MALKLRVGIRNPFQRVKPSGISIPASNCSHPSGKPDMSSLWLASRRLVNIVIFLFCGRMGKPTAATNVVTVLSRAGSYKKGNKKIKNKEIK